MSKRLLYCLFALIVAMGAFLRLYRLGTPADYKFDEIYHVPTFILISRGDARAYEWWHQELTSEFGDGAYIDWLHPPLAKLIQASIFLLGGNKPAVWRLASGLFGIAMVIAVFAFARSLFPHSPATALLAAALIAIDGLAISMSRIAMNDIFVSTWCVVALYGYWQFCRRPRGPHQIKWLWVWTLATGFACASKWSGWLLFPFYFFWEMLQVTIFNLYRDRVVWARLLFSGCITLIIYVLSYGQMFALGYGWSHFIQLHDQILNYQLHLDATHTYASKAYEWPLGLKPVHLYHDAQTGANYWNKPFYPSWYLCLGALVALLIFLVIDFVKHLQKRQSNLADRVAAFTHTHEAVLFCLLAYFALWTPWLFSPRIMYFHHYLPAVPFLTILAGRVLAALLESPITTPQKSQKDLTN